MRGGCLPVVGVVALVTIPAGLVLGVVSVNSPMLLLALPLLPIGAVVLAVVVLPLVARSSSPTVVDKERGKIVRLDPPPATRWVGSGGGRWVTPRRVTPKPESDPTFEEQCARMERGEMGGPELADFINRYGTKQEGRRGRRTR